MSRGRKSNKLLAQSDHNRVYQNSKGFYFEYIIAQLGKEQKIFSSPENTDELLKKIKIEKDILIKDKKIKQGKLQDAEILHELLFDIPNYWVWCKLDDICLNITDGTHQTPNYIESGRPFISAQHVKPFCFNPNNLKYVSEDAYQECIKSGKPEIGDILITRVGAIGEAAVIDIEMEFAYYVSVGLIKPFKEYINSRYIEFVFNSPYGNKYSKGNISSKGSSAGNFNLGRIRSFLIPLPPLSEQNNIVDFLNDFENDNLKTEGYYFNHEVEQKVIALHTSQLTGAEISSELSLQLSLLKSLRQQLLQDAVQGKLVPQDSTEGNAQDLLAQIKAEKAQLIKDKKLKKEKDLPQITAAEIPFEIPDNWVWCRLGEIINGTEGGKSPNCFHKPAQNNEWGVIKTTAVQEMYFLENENKVLPKNFIMNMEHKVNEGDILITRAGPKNRVGIVCYVENLTQNLILSDKTIRIKYSEKLLFPKYISIALNSPSIKVLIEPKMTGMADSQVNISQDNMKQFLIPLPPLSEQKRIVQKLESLMQSCDALTASIKQSASENEQLLQQVLREALQTR